MEIYSASRCYFIIIWPLRKYLNSKLLFGIQIELIVQTQYNSCKLSIFITLMTRPVCILKSKANYIAVNILVGCSGGLAPK